MLTRLPGCSVWLRRVHPSLPVGESGLQLRKQQVAEPNLAPYLPVRTLCLANTR